eukprot:13653883-Alexandrium_andersonii.AAC.1
MTDAQHPMDQTQVGSLVRLKLHSAVLGGFRRVWVLLGGTVRSFQGAVRRFWPALLGAFGRPMPHFVIFIDRNTPRAQMWGRPRKECQASAAEEARKRG